MHIIRNQDQKSLWLSQLSYIKKVKSQFIKEEPSKLPDTLIQDKELFPFDQNANDKERTLY